MKPSDCIDIAIPYELISQLLGLPADIKAAYHSQKTNTLYLRVSQQDVHNPCFAATVGEPEKGSLTITIHRVNVPTFGKGATRSPGRDFRVSNYLSGLTNLGSGIIKYNKHTLLTIENIPEDDQQEVGTTV